MNQIPKLIGFFIIMAILISFSRDIAIGAFGKEEHRGANLSSGNAVVVKHLDWGTLRVGHSPKLLEKVALEDGSSYTLDETINETMKKNRKLPIKRKDVEIVLSEGVALIGINSRTDYQSSFISLVNKMADDSREEWIDVPNRSVHIIEAKQELYPY